MGDVVRPRDIRNAGLTTGNGFAALMASQLRATPHNDTDPSPIFRWSMASKSEGGYRDERRLDHDRADRQQPNLVFCLIVHEIPTRQAPDRSRPRRLNWRRASER